MAKRLTTMTNNIFQKIVIAAVLLSFSFVVTAEEKKADLKKDKTSEAYQLSYIEREPGVDDYEVTMLVSDRYIRIDEQDEASGYIVYDDRDKVIYSVSRSNRT
jgi:hypothetical protein